MTYLLVNSMMNTMVIGFFDNPHEALEKYYELITKDPSYKKLLTNVKDKFPEQEIDLKKILWERYSNPNLDEITEDILEHLLDLISYQIYNSADYEIETDVYLEILSLYSEWILEDGSGHNHLYNVFLALVDDGYLREAHQKIDLDYLSKHYRFIGLD